MPEEIEFKTYHETEGGGFRIENMHIPKAEANRHYRMAMQEVEAGNAEIIPYVEPKETTDQKIGKVERTVTREWVRGAILGDQLAIAKIRDVEDRVAAIRSEALARLERL